MTIGRRFGALVSGAGPVDNERARCQAQVSGAHTSLLFFTSPLETEFANCMADSRQAAENADIEVCATYLKALGDPVRLQVVRALRTGPLSVSDVATLLDMEIANVSHHLRVLYHAKLVTTTREGKYIYYTLNGDFLTGRAAIKLLDFGCCQIDLKS